MKFELQRRSLIEAGLYACPLPNVTPFSDHISWDEAGDRWVIDINSIEDLLRIGVRVEAPLRILAVGGDEDDLNIIEILDTEDMPHQVEKPMKIKGLHEGRFQKNPEERRFANAWKKQNELGKTVDYLLWEGDRRGSPPTASPRDQVVAATVIQWLGSPVGESFLNDLGYKK
jgi:hypothetical protein